MSRLVEDLLLLAHAEDAGFLRPSRSTCPSSWRDRRRHAADRRPPAGARPTFRDLVLEADPDRLTQAVRNLLRNAIVHTEPGGLVRLGGAGRGDRVRLTVDDDGPGVPPRTARRDLRPLRPPGRRPGRDLGGAGLGPLDRPRDRRAHGGETAVETSPEGGARFVLDLPLEQSGRERPAPRTAERPPASR